MTTRRDVLRGAGMMGGAGVMAGALPGFGALAQTGGGYRALVCVFLAGGMDGHDAVIPSDEAGHAEWTASRESLVQAYAALGDTSRERTELLPLGQQADGRAFGMPRQMAGLHGAYEAGDLAVVGNVGPLVVPTTGADAKQERVPLPARLMSHNDQQSMWQSLSPEGAVSGWGGRMRDLAAAASPFSAISVSSNPVFLAGKAQPFVLGTGGVHKVHATGTDWAYGSRDVPAAFEAHLTASAASMDSLIASDLQASRRANLAAINDLAAMVEASDAGDDVKVEQNKLSDQLAVVAKMIALRGQLGVSRQVFFVKMGGFDTHDGQAEKLPVLQAKLSEAMASFHGWTERAGMADMVTTFTASEFGRTLTANATGTDHGWGGHHLVMGGAVDGGRIIGEVPPAVEGHAQDHGRGRMVPTTATVQYAASLGRWFGLSASELLDVLPGLEEFDPAGARLF